MMCFNSILLPSKTLLGGSNWVASCIPRGGGGGGGAAASASTSKGHGWKFTQNPDVVVKTKSNQQRELENSTPPLNTNNENEERMGSKRRRRRRQVMRRSGLLAKQVISIQSALSLGFVSQLWIHTSSWVVLVVEVRHNLLSGESESFFLRDIMQVGDVVLVRDDFVLEAQLPMLGLHSLVGYRVVTPNQQTIGKVRGYSFNIESGAVESLELDSFGISIIPSSLVSTYRLLVEDVMEVLSDTVIVHEAAASHIQRLTKGFWDTQKSESSTYEVDEYSAQGNSTRSDQNINPWKSQKFSPSRRKPPDDWELPKDYL